LVTKQTYCDLVDLRFFFVLPIAMVFLESLTLMNFQDLHELVRLELLRRVDQGDLTGTKLAQQAGFQQAHISNFLNKKRALSLEGLDRVLAAQGLTIDQLLPIQLDAAAAIAPGDTMESVPVVSSSVAMESPFVTASSLIEMIQVSASRLQGNRPRPLAKRSHWQRFVAIRTDAQQAASMEPMLTAGTIAVVDRHYNSLAPYRAHQPTLYAVRCGAALLLRFVDFDEERMILRPYSRAFPVQLIPMGPDEAPADFIVGRVCLLLSEL
jgi:plasmid maintenance system antidote protein VapI